MLLLLLFIAVPLIEIALFIQLGSVLSLGWILLIVVLTAVLGTYLVRRQGQDALARLGQSFNDLRDPTEPLAHGAMILFSGALLLTPGFFTDTIGFLLLIPPVRSAVFQYLRSRIKVQGASFTSHTEFTARSGSSTTQRRTHDTVIDGDYHEVKHGLRPISVRRHTVRVLGMDTPLRV